jgi:DNA-binding CsgD family transcriptional regulator
MEWARKIVGSEFVITIQTNASSLVRTWYHPDRLPDAIRKAFPGKRFTFLIFDGARWQLLKGNNVFPVAIPSTIDPMRSSCAIVSESDIFIGADSGLSHVAEAVQTQSIVFYTTVPAWTRTKYYKYSHPVEPIGEVFDGVRCRPCFVLDRYCPRIRERALSQLTPREIRIKDAAEKGESPQLVAKEFNTTEQGILMESEILQRRYNALIEEQAPCTTTITPERIVDEVKKIIEGIK